MVLDDAIVHLISVDEEPLILTRKQGLNQVSEHHGYYSVFDSSLLFTLCTRHL